MQTPKANMILPPLMTLGEDRRRARLTAPGFTRCKNTKSKTYFESTDATSNIYNLPVKDLVNLSAACTKHLIWHNSGTTKFGECAFSHASPAA